MDTLRSPSTDSTLALLGIQRVERGDGYLLTLAGELDASNEHQVVEEVKRCDGFVTLDTCGITFLDSRGLISLITSRDHVGGDRFELCLLADGPVHRLLELTGLSDQFNLTSSPFQP